MLESFLHDASAAFCDQMVSYALALPPSTALYVFRGMEVPLERAGVECWRSPAQPVPKVGHLQGRLGAFGHWSESG